VTWNKNSELVRNKSWTQRGKREKAAYMDATEKLYSTKPGQEPKGIITRKDANDAPTTQKAVHAAKPRKKTAKNPV